MITKNCDNKKIELNYRSAQDDNNKQQTVADEGNIYPAGNYMFKANNRNTRARWGGKVFKVNNKDNFINYKDNLLTLNIFHTFF